MHKYIFDFVCLLDLDADADAVDTRLDENLFIFISRHCERIQQDFWRAGSFYLGYIVPFCCL